jgi:Sec-independent protein translocase protein TatA
MSNNLGLLSNLAGRDMLVILVIVALVFFGGRKLPAIARAIKRIPSSFRKGLRDGSEPKEKTNQSREDSNS